MEAKTPEEQNELWDIVKSLAMFTFIRGNWQKPVKPEELQTYVDAIDSYVKQEALKARIDELQKWHSFDEPADEIANRISRLESQLNQSKERE